MQVQGGHARTATCSGGGDQSLGLPFVPRVGLGLPPGLLQRRKWVSSVSGTYQKPSVQPQALELGGIRTDKVSPQFTFAFDVNQPAALTGIP